MPTKINIYKQSGTDVDTRVNFNVPRSLTYGLNARANDNGGVTESDNCEYNTLNALYGINYEPLPIQPETAAYLAFTGITGTTEVNAINKLVYELKQNNLWSKMKAVYPFVTDQRNLAGYSEDITNITGWNSVIMTRTANTTVAPNGTLTADTFTTGSNGNNAVWNLGWIAGNGQTFTNSIYLKYNNAQWVTLEIWEGSGQNGIRLWVDIQNGVLGTANATVGTYLTSSILSVGNGWYRVSLTGIIPGVNNAILVVRHVDGNGAYNFTAVSGLSTYCWGAQNEIGTLTAYQPQLGSAQTAISTQFKYNLIDGFNFKLVFNGGWNMSALGATPNGVNGYADTQLAPLSVLTQDNSHMSYYSRTDQANGSFIEMGTESPDFLLWYKAFSLTRGNLDGTMDYTPTVTSTQGFLLASKYSTSQGLMQYNGTQQLKTSVFGNTRSVKNIYLGAINSTGATYFSAKQTAFATIGNGLTGTEATILYSLVQQYQTFLNRQIP